MQNNYRFLGPDKSGWEYPNTNNVYLGGNWTHHNFYGISRTGYGTNLFGKKRIDIGVVFHKKQLLKKASCPEDIFEIERLERWHTFVWGLFKDNAKRYTFSTDKRPKGLSTGIPAEGKQLLLTGSQIIQEVASGQYRLSGIDVNFTCAQTGEVFSSKALFEKSINKAGIYELKLLAKAKLRKFTADQLKEFLTE